MLVLGMGNACLDTQLTLERLPAPGGKAPVLEQRQLAGGQIAGALVGCRRLGLEARFLLRCGDDEAGRRLRAALAAEDLDLAPGRVLAGVPTASAWILRDSSGERIVLWSTDPRLAVEPDEITPALFDGVAALLFDGRDGPACLRAARLARARGIPVVGDLDCHYAHTPELLPWIDHLVVPESFAPPPPLARRVVVVTRGERGATGWEQGGEAIASPAFAVPVADTTGAGDAFHAGYIYALLQGWDLAQRLRFANAAAALACGAAGALAGLPRRPQVEALLAAGAAR
ncbi:MAG TPA: PfkB family carbohydrate kinase [Terriglobales bacterium]|nr:PfkB family carbohydrate kinase [Terriglobales bacterium]